MVQGVRCDIILSWDVDMFENLSEMRMQGLLGLDTCNSKTAMRGTLGFHWLLHAGLLAQSNVHQCRFGGWLANAVVGLLR